MEHTHTKRVIAIAASIVVAGAAAVSTAGPAYANGSSGGHGHGDPKKDTSRLRDAITADGLMAHLDALQDIADANDGTRAAGTPGYEASGAYVESQLQQAGYTTHRQYFSYEQFVLDSAAFALTAPTTREFVIDTEFAPMSYSGSGDAAAPVQAVDINLDGDRASTSGCEAEDFAGFTATNIALIQRGSCDFAVKAANAQAAGASGVVIFNQGNTVEGDDRFGVVAGTLGAAGVTTLPVVGTSFEIGQQLATTTGATASLSVLGELATTETFNVLADTSGDASNTVIVGAHLDSVAAGPGINDNGSGTATLLETAIQLSELGIRTQNAVRFAFWGGEEDNLQGSNYYVSQLSDADLDTIALNLNFDMLGSTNAVRFVYDGDGDAFGTAGPEGSADIEKVFTDYFAAQGLPTAPTAFDGRSDYFGFIEAGIPAGGLFSGAEGIKTDEEAATFGGVAGEPYDACYHQACDTVANVDPAGFEQMADAAAHATLTFAKQKPSRHGHHGHGWGDSHGWSNHGGQGHGDGHGRWKGHHSES